MKLIQIISHLTRNYCTKFPTSINACSGIEKLKLGDEATITKVITDEDIQNFAKLTGDYNPIHTNSPKKIIHGALLNGIISGLLGTKLPGPGTLVVEQSLRFPNSCHAGDTIEAKVQLVSVRKLIKCEFKCIANGEKVVLTDYNVYNIYDNSSMCTLCLYSRGWFKNYY